MDWLPLVVKAIASRHAVPMRTVGVGLKVVDDSTGLVTRSCVYVHGECVAQNNHAGLLLVALGLVSAAIVYGVVFVRRDNLRSRMPVLGPALAVVCGAIVVVLAYSW